MILRLPAVVGSAALLSALLAATPATAADVPVAKAPASGAAAPAAPLEADGLIVQLEERASSARVAAAAEDLDADVEVKERTGLGDGLTAIATTETLEAGQAQDLAAEIAQRPDVAWAEPDYRVTVADASPVTVSDPGFAKQRFLWDSRTAGSPTVKARKLRSWPGGGFSSKAPSLWRTTEGRADAVVAVVDTGIALEDGDVHPDLREAVLRDGDGTVAGYDFISLTRYSNDGTGRDGDPSDPGDWSTKCDMARSSWHGTHVAGIVAARRDGRGVVGVAPGVKVLPVRALGTCGGTTSDILAAMRWSAGLPVPGAPANPNPADVVNLSLGAPARTCSTAWRDTIAEVRRAGAVVVAAAGNEAQNAATSTPANCSAAITVASTSEFGDLAAYSNYGSIVDVSAQGGDSAWFGGDLAQGGILSTYNKGRTTPGAHGYAYLEGTSMAAPVVAGAVALYKSAGITGVARLEQAVRTAVTSFPRSQHTAFATCSTARCGSGILDLSAIPRVSSPKISGTAKPGSTLTATAASWLLAPASVAGRWYVDGQATSTTGNRFTVARSHSGRRLEYRVTAKRAGFRTTAASAAVRVARTPSKVAVSLPRTASPSARVAVTVAVRATGFQPTGRVSVVIKGKRVASVVLRASARGKAVLRLPRLKAGEHRLRVEYAGSTNVLPSRSTVKTLTIR